MTAQPFIIAVIAEAMIATAVIVIAVMLATIVLRQTKTITPQLKTIKIATI